jgi:hypothetical protein
MRFLLSPGRWHKQPTMLGLRSLPSGSSVEKCYMKEPATYNGGISREHLISESILLLLKADGDFTISGLPWLAAGETKILGPEALTANCLCEKHNSALSPLDATALYYVSALKSCLDKVAAAPNFIVSGCRVCRPVISAHKFVFCSVPSAVYQFSSKAGLVGGINKAVASGTTVTRKPRRRFIFTIRKSLISFPLQNGGNDGERLCRSTPQGPS